MTTVSSATSNTGTGTISSPGVGSGLDVETIVSKLMAIEQQPLTLLQQKEASYTTQLTAVGQISSPLSSFQTAAQALKSAGASTAFKLSSSDPSISGSATSAASAGTYTVTVSKLAQSQGLVAAGQTSTTTAIGSSTDSTLTIGFGAITGGSFDANTGLYSGAAFTPDATRTPASIDIRGNSSLSDIRDAINAANAGVTAAIVNDGSGTPYRLTITSNDTGANSSLRIDVTGDAAVANLLAYDPGGTQRLTQTSAAQDAALTVNGISVTSSTNTVTDAIPKATLSLTSPVTNAKVTVQQDTSAIRTALGNLVTAYNSANSTIAGLTGLSATLQGNSAVLGIQAKLRSAIGNLLGGSTSQFTSLSQLGVAFQKDGSLKFDPSMLQTALATSTADVMKTVSAFGTSLSSVASDIVDSSGLLQSQTNGLNATIKNIQDQENTLQKRLTDIETQYRAQFSALDALIGTMQQTSSFLTQQLANLPKIGS